jgi:hypothetical protein
LTCLANAANGPCSDGTGYTVHGVVIGTSSYGSVCTAALGLFAYNGGNFQAGAASDGPAGLYNATRGQLQTYVNGQIGTSPTFTYGTTLLAGGANNSAAGMAAWLTAIVNDQLLMHDALGTYAVCTSPDTRYALTPFSARNNFVGQVLWDGSTNPNGHVTVTGGTGGTTITNAGTPNGPWISQGKCIKSTDGGTPIPENWQYSIAHWVETDPNSNGDGAFSSPGSKGVYPWISADKTLYGVIARVGATGGVGYQSAQCGRLIRHAYVTGIQQTGTIPTP